MDILFIRTSVSDEIDLVRKALRCHADGDCASCPFARYEEDGSCIEELLGLSGELIRQRNIIVPVAVVD